MKNLVLLITGVLMTLTTVTAAEQVKSASHGEDLTMNRYRFDQPIQFIERGVEFLIFPDGSFDFNTNTRHLGQSSHNNYYKTSKTKHKKTNNNYGTKRGHVNFSKPTKRGTLITHDNNGKVRRIGNLFVNYNHFDQVKRLGSVYMNYNRKGLLTQVGGLHLKYNRKGRVINTFGQVNPNKINSFCGTSNNYNSNNNDYYYKKSNKTNTKSKHKKRRT